LRDGQRGRVAARPRHNKQAQAGQLQLGDCVAVNHALQQRSPNRRPTHRRHNHLFVLAKAELRQLRFTVDAEASRVEMLHVTRKCVVCLYPVSDIWRPYLPDVANASPTPQCGVGVGFATGQLAVA
jgi:hypothetical protein